MAHACYTARATTRSEVHKGMSKINLTKNAAGKYSHENILTAIKQLKRVFAGQFNPSASGPVMAKLLEAMPNALTNKKSSFIYDVDSVLQEARNTATAADITPPTAPLLTLHTDAQDEAELQNRFT